MRLGAPFTTQSAPPMRGRLMRWLRRHVNAHCIHVVTYHSVAPHDNPFTRGLPLRHTPDEFAAHMAYLRRHYRPVSLGRVIHALEEDRPLSRAVVVTFDDGFRDVITHALPILRDMRIPATMFLVTSLVGNVDLLWRHKLAWLVGKGLAPRTLAALLSEYQRNGVDLPTDTFRRASDAQPDLFELTRRCFRPDITIPVLDSLLAENGWSGPALAARYRPYVERADVVTPLPGLDFGNHTHTHPMLSMLTPARQMHELSAAAELIQQWTGRRPLAVAYPFGLRDSYDAATIDAVRASGHRAALDLRRRVNAGPVSPFNLSRFPAPRGGLAAFERAIEDGPAAAMPTASFPGNEHLLLSRRMFRGTPKPVRLHTHHAPASTL